MSHNSLAFDNIELYRKYPKTSDILLDWFMDYSKVTSTRSGVDFDIEPDTYGNLDEWFRDSNWITPEIFNDTKSYLEELLNSADYYIDEDGEAYIELSKTPLLNNVSSKISAFDWDGIVEDAIEIFEDNTNVEVFILGRSGKHVCVELNLDNLINFNKLKAEVESLQKEMITKADSYVVAEESFGYDTSVDDPEIYEIDASLNDDIDFDKKIVNREELFNFVNRVANLYKDDAPENEILAISTFLGDYNIYIRVTESMSLNEDIDDDTVYALAKDLADLYKDYDFYDFRDCYDSDEEAIFEIASTIKDGNVDNIFMYLNYMIDNEAGELKTEAENLISRLKSHLNIDECLTEDIDDEDEWIEVKSKNVYDTDGFMTDYTMYKNSDGTKYIFMFGDKDIYEPNEDYADWECETEKEANEWFDSYDNNPYDEDDYYADYPEGEDDSQEWLNDPDIGIFGFEESLTEDTKNEQVKHKIDDIEFIMGSNELIGSTIKDITKIDPITYELVDHNDNSVIIKFDPTWSEWVFDIDGEGPFSYGSYEYIIDEARKAFYKKEFDSDFNTVLNALKGEKDKRKISDYIEDQVETSQISYDVYDALVKYFNLNESLDESLTEDINEKPKVSWDDFESYSEDEIEEIDDILDNYELSVDKVEESNVYDDFNSVLVCDNVSGYDFWVDFRIKDGEIEDVEWNQYIFSTKDHEDRIRKALQTAYSDDWSFFAEVEEVAENALYNFLNDNNANLDESLTPNKDYGYYRSSLRSFGNYNLGDSIKTKDGRVGKIYRIDTNPYTDYGYFEIEFEDGEHEMFSEDQLKTEVLLDESVTTTPIATYYVSGDLGIIIYNINYGIDDEVVWAWSNTPDEIETSDIEYEYGDNEYDSCAFFMADDEKVYLDDCLKSFHESVDNNSDKSFETMSLTALNKLPREKLIQITRDFMNRHSEFYEDFTDFFDWHFGERFGYSDLEDLVTEDIAWFYFNIVKNAKKDHSRSFNENKYRKINSRSLTEE